MNDHVLITGSPGSGKTYLAALAREQGLNAVDADLIPGVYGWFHHTGAAVVFPDDADAVFFDEHRFLWNRPVLERFLSENPGVLLFGMAANAFDMLDLFDRAYFLRVSPETLRSRLTHPSRANPMGAMPEQQALVLESADADLHRAQDDGLAILDGEAPAQEILDTITSR